MFLHLKHSFNPFILLFQIIYVHRDPKDAAISYFHHYRLLNDFTGTMNDFLRAFTTDQGTEARWLLLLSTYIKIGGPINWGGLWKRAHK